jgi:hypothetical protein
MIIRSSLLGMNQRTFIGDIRLTIVSHDMHTFFKPVVNKILGLLEQQLADINKQAKSYKIDVSICLEPIVTPRSNTDKTILLVGGFGDSRYLNERLRSWGQKRAIRVLCPKDPQAAIVKGAAVRGLEGLRPSQRRCRRHYGFTIATEYQPGDPEDECFTDSYYNTKFRKGGLEWPIKKVSKAFNLFDDAILTVNARANLSTRPRE